MRPLIEVSELNDRHDEVALFDIRWSLTDPDHGRNTYRSGHIPGAVFVDLDKDLAAAPDLGRHPLPDVAEFAATLGRLGITSDTEVIVYDDAGGTIAARMWWMLRAIGHDEVRLLDGGYVAWTDSGLPVETGDVSPTAADYPIPRDFVGAVTRDGLEGRLVIDVRSGDRYRGEHEPVDPRPGHIPGAVNRPTLDNLGADGRFLSDAGLRLIHGPTGERPVISCGSGVNACHTALAMVLAGHEMPDIYIGSYSEWSNLDLPVCTGDAS
jgi:thiosulfate/3-mercaptopyruvate sulfurtransferase